MTRPTLRGLSTIAALAAASLAQPAYADFVSSGGGDFALTPLYRSLTYSAVNFGNNGTPFNGVDYVSNVAPLTLATGNTNAVVNGATFTAVGQAAWSGFYAGRNYASMTVSNANPDDTYYVQAGQGSATSVRFFTEDAAAERAVFTWHVSGESENPQALPPTLSGVGPTTGRLDFGASTDSTVTWLDLFEEDLNTPSSEGKLNSIRKFGPGIYTYTLPTVPLGTTINLFYWSSVFAQVDANTTAIPNYTLTANYYNTIVLDSVELFDAYGNAIQNWSLVDVTGVADPSDPSLGTALFNQDGRTWSVLAAPPLADPPPLTGNTVPIPGTTMLLGLGIVGLGVVGRGRSTRHAKATV